MEGNTKESFHILWKDSLEDLYSKGELFTGVDAIEAIQAYKNKYPNTHFLGCFSLNISLQLVKQISDI